MRQLNDLLALYLRINDQSRRMAGWTAAKKYILSQDQLNQIAAIASRAGVKAYKDEQAKNEKNKSRNEDKVRRTKKMLSSYRRMKATLSDEREFTEAEKIELRWRFIEDLMGNSNELVSKSETVIIDQEKKRQENLYCIQSIENAIRLYQEECEKSSSEERESVGSGNCMPCILLLRRKREGDC